MKATVPMSGVQSQASLVAEANRLLYWCSYTQALHKNNTSSLENDCFSPTPPFITDFSGKSPTLFSHDKIRPQPYTPKNCLSYDDWLASAGFNLILLLRNYGTMECVLRHMEALASC